jgi:hypothetical protein
VTDYISRLRIPNWNHQAKEWEFRDVDGRMLRWQMRTGKTKAVIDLCCYRYEELQVTAVIIAAPNNVHANWPRKELPKHMWDGVPWMAITYDAVKSRNISWRQRFEEALRFKGLLFLCVNCEAFANLRFQDEVLKPFLKARGRFGFVGDETHDLSRRTGSKKSKAIRGVAHKAVFRRGLSGTITDNCPLHAYGQYELIARAALGFETQAAFDKRYSTTKKIYVAGGATRDVVDEYVNQEELRAKMAKWTSVVLRSECEDLPPLIEEQLEFEMTPAQKLLYNDVARGALVRLDRGEIVPPAEGGAVVIRLQQIASGWVVDEDGNVHDVMPPEENPRLVALESILALCGPKTIIWCRFREDIVRVYEACKKWGYKPVHYYGSTKTADRAKAEDRFQSDPKVGPMVANLKACGQGLDFSAASDIIHYSHTHGDLIARSQGNERATQMGGVSKTLTDMVALGSNDQLMLDDFAGKHETSEFVSGEGLRRFLELAR